jgi:hypothetical protein
MATNQSQLIFVLDANDDANGDAGSDTFVFHIGQAAGGTVMDFAPSRTARFHD